MPNRSIGSRWIARLVSILACVGVSGVLHAGWFGPGWTERQKIRVLPTVADSDQTDFPVLIEITDSLNSLFGTAQSDGDDIVFTAADGTTQLAHEIEKYSDTTDELYAWVKLPNLSSSVDNEIYLYYGNGAVSSQASPEDVWDDDFVAVWHMHQDPSGTLLDSTRNDIDLTVSVGMDSADLIAAGRVGPSIDFDNSPNYLHSASQTVTLTTFTMEAWLSSDSWSGWRTVVNVDNGSNYRQFGSIGSMPMIDAVDDGTQYRLAPNQSGNAWRHLVARYDDAAGSNRVRGYLDGQPEDTANPNFNSVTGRVIVGSYWWFGDSGFHDFWNGRLDEIRISRVARSADWIEASYRIQNDPGTYLVFEAPEPPSYTIAGTVFEDIVGDALADGTVDDVNNPGVQNVDVHLYLDDADGIPEVTDAFQATVQTGASGAFSFTGLAAGSYFVVVDSKTVAPGAAFNSGFGQTDVWAEQTYGPAGALCADGSGGTQTAVAAGTCYGGRRGDTSDDLTTWHTGAEHVVAVSVAADVTAVDLGFSFHPVTTVRGGDTTDDDPGANRRVQGSLRQFIDNANAISGASAMRFVPAEPTNATDGGSNDWWSIAVSDGLPLVRDPSTTVDGTAYSFLDGTTVRDTNTAQIGAGAVVGVDGIYTTPRLDPELALDGDGVVNTGLGVAEAHNSVVRGLAIHGFRFDGLQVNGSLTLKINGFLVEQNVLGTSPASFTDLGAQATEYRNMQIYHSVAGTVRDNLIGFSGSTGISFSFAGVGVTVERNEIRGHRGYWGAGISIMLSASQVSGDITVRGNLIEDNEAPGVTTWRSFGDNVIDNNTIRNNGVGGVDTVGVHVGALNDTVSKNVITGNTGPGVIVIGERPITSTTHSAATGGRISRNVFGGNTGNAIDLVASTDDGQVHWTGDGISINDGSSPATSGNRGLDYPVITSADTSTVQGTACPSCEIEVYRAVADGDASDTSGLEDYGEGVEYVGTANANGSGDWTLSGITSLSGGDSVSAIAIDGSDNTSEFSANVAIPGAGSNVGGTVFEDADFAGTASDWDGGVGDLGLVSVDVELYDAGDDSFVDSVTTTAGGSFTFSSVADGSYKLRVRAATIGDADTPPAAGLNGTVPATWPYPLAEMTWGGGTSMLGGQSATADDTATGDDAGPGDTWVPVTVSGADVTGVNVGFAYTLVVNTADDGAVDNLRGGQGSLRQFLKNVNAIVGAQTSYFAIPNTDPGYNGTGNGEYTIQPPIRLPFLVDRVTLDGTTHPDFTNRPLIEISAPLFADGLRVAAGSDSSEIRGLIINRFQNDAIELVGGASSITIAGNYIGTDPTGNAALANSRGVYLNSGSNGCTIGGVGTNDGNVISGNTGDAIQLNGAGAITGTTIVGNTIGVGADGTTPVGNGGHGVGIHMATFTQVGGTTAEAANVIGDNAVGVSIIWGNANDNTVEGNFIGTDTATTEDLGNGTGVWIRTSTQNNLIGGTTSPAANVIKFNGVGIRVDGAAGPRNTFLGNRVVGNDGLGIDLEGGVEDVFGVTENDAGDLDTGPNRLINFPEITSAVETGGSVSVDFDLDLPAASVRIEFFRNPSGTDGSGHGEGEVPVDSTVVTHGGTGNESFSHSIAGAAGDWITATTTACTDGAACTTFGSTSEFSEAVEVVEPGIAGIVFEDADFAGTATTYDGGVGDAPLANVDVELYDADAGDAFVASTTTDGTGSFGFTALADGNYKVRVRSATIGDADTPPAGGLNGTVPGTWPYPLAEMTWGNGVAMYGGQSPVADDTATGNDAGPGDTWVPATVSGNNVTGVDFGFAYNLIVNTGDDANLDATRSAQGGLRQFLKNANAIGTAGGTTANSSRFRIAGAGPHTIQPVQALPVVVDPLVLDGYTQPGAQANTVAAPGATDAILRIEIEGSALGSVDGLYLGTGSDGSTLRGLVVNRFGDNGIEVRSSGNTIEGNYIGTDVAGTSALGNGFPGLSVSAGTDNLIGGTTAASRNVISGNDHRGVYIRGNGTDRTLVKGNYIGLDADGAVMGNLYGGVRIDSMASLTEVGGTEAGAENFIGGNRDGVSIEHSNTTGTLVRGNYIGTDLAGTADLGNTRHGVMISDGARSHTIGGSATDAANVIAFNDGDGVFIVDGGTDFNVISGNSIHSNDGLGIDLGADGPSLNDGGDVDTGANDGLNFAVLDTARVSGANLELAGWARPGSVIEVFVSDADPSDFGEGETWVITLTEGGTGGGGEDPYADQDATTSGYGPGAVNGIAQGEDTTNRFRFAFPLPTGVTAGTRLTTTARDGAGNTSEFGGQATVVSQLTIVKRAFQSDGTPIAGGSTLPAGMPVKFLLYVDNPAGPISDVSLRDVLDPLFAYEAGSMKMDNTLVSGVVCPAGACDEAAIFAQVDASGAALGDGDAGTPPIDADVGSYTSGTQTIDVGDGANPGNASLDLAGGRVWALIFTIRMQ